MRDRMRKRVIAAFCFFALLAVAAYLLAPASPVFPVLRAVLGLVFVLFLPGYLAARVLFSGKADYTVEGQYMFVEEEIDSLERLALSIGLSISLVVLTVMFSNLALKIPINAVTSVAEISALCLVFISLRLLQDSSGFMRHYSRAEDFVMLRHEKNPKRRLLIHVGFSVLLLLLAIDFGYPLLTSPLEINNPAPVSGFRRPERLNLSDFYSPSMAVQSYYPQKNIELNETGVKIQYPTVFSFENKIAFLGYDLDKREAAPGETLHISYYWKALEKIDANYSVFVHFTDMNGKILFQQDHDFKQVLALPPNALIEDFENINEWTIDGPGINGSSFTSSTDQIKVGNYSGKLSYNFTTSGNDYVILNNLIQLTGKPKKIGLWVYGDNSSQRLKSRFLDANGEMYQPTYGKIDWTGWKYIEMPLNDSKQDHWGGDLNNVINYPIRFYSLILDDFPDSYTGNGTIYLSNLKLLGETNDSSEPQYFGIPTTSRWNKGQIIEEGYNLKIPENNASVYIIRIGLFDKSKDKTLQITDGIPSDNENRAIIGIINIKQ